MKKILFILTLLNYGAGFSQSTKQIESLLTFDKAESIKCNEPSHYCLYKSIFSEEVYSAGNYLVELRSSEYVLAKYLPNYAAYVVYNTSSDEVITYLKSVGEFDSLYYQLKVVAADLDQKNILLENPYYTGKKKTELYDTSGWPIETLEIDKYKILDVEKGYFKNGYSISAFYYDSGGDLFNAKKYLNSLYCWRKYYDMECVKRTKPNRSSCSFALMRMGECKERLGDDYGAREYYHKYVMNRDDINWNYRVIFIRLAEIEFRFKNYTNAIQYIDSAISLEKNYPQIIPPPNFGYMKLFRGYALYNTQQIEKACSTFSEALELGEQRALLMINSYCNKPYQGEIKVEFNSNSQNVSLNKEDNRIIVPLIKKNGDLYEIETNLNGVVKVKFILDSGASQVTITTDVLSTLMRSGTLKQEDFIGQHTFIMADGSQVKSDVFNLSSIEVGGFKISNIKATVVKGNDASLLLGQNVLKKLGNFTIDYAKSQLVINRN